MSKPIIKRIEKLEAISGDEGDVVKRYFSLLLKVIAKKPREPLDPDESFEENHEYDELKTSLKNFGDSMTIQDKQKIWEAFNNKPNGFNPSISR